MFIKILQFNVMSLFYEHTMTVNWCREFGDFSESLLQFSSL